MCDSVPRAIQRAAFIACMCMWFACVAAADTLCISEFMAQNDATLYDDDGDRPDWIEIFNPGTVTVNLAGWHLTDDTSNMVKWTFPATNMMPGSYLLVYASGKNRITSGAPLHASFKLAREGEYLGLVEPDGMTVATEFRPAYPPQCADVSFGFSSGTRETLVATGAPCRVLVPASAAFSNAWLFGWFDDAAWTTGVTGVGYDRNTTINYNPFIGTQVGQMYGGNPSCYIRIPFILDNPAQFDSVRLSMSYDDGFVACINGTVLAAANMPLTPQWNSLATAGHDDAAAVVFEEFLVPYADMLQPGTNILAIQACNVSTTSSDLLALPVLDAVRVGTFDTNMPAYFPAPSPGAINVGGVANLGPAIRTPAHEPAQPGTNDSIVITCTVTQSFAPVATVALQLRVMYGAVTSVAMADDGNHGDGSADDGIFGAVITNKTDAGPSFSAGDMVRWYFTATDVAGRTSRWPLFASSIDSAEYLGTVIQADAATNMLPVLHWFVDNPAMADQDPGTRCSIFFEGALHDNVYVRLRGQTSRWTPKKSHKFEMSGGSDFVFRPGAAPVDEFNLNSTYSDKAYVRAVLAYELMAASGLPAPETFPVQVRQNGGFHSVAHLSEDIDRHFLRKNGLDDDGALYKSAGGTTYDKKTREWEGTADITALINGLNLSSVAREQFIFDNVDLPGMVNYMATACIAQNIDGSDKNHFLYRDTEATGEWRMLPWDLDLTFGPNALWTDTIVYNQCDVAAPACASHPFIGARPYLLQAGKYHIFLEAIVNSPRAKEMLLRRIRQLTETRFATPFLTNRLEQLFTALNADVLLDYATWGADAHFAGTTYTLRQAIDRIRNEYLVPRLPFLRSTSITGIGTAMPAPQPATAVVSFAAVEAAPASGRNDEEFICFTNRNPYAVDMSLWVLTGGVRHTFRPGTVIPARGALYLTPNAVAFRARSTAPRGGQSLFIQGNYRGQLSSWGESLHLYDDTGRLVSELTYTGTPTRVQQHLRISELMYHPNDPTSGVPFLDEDYEFIELFNTDLSPLSISGVQFVSGIEFTAMPPVVVIQPTSCVVLVRNIAAFAEKYNTNAMVVAGIYSGKLANEGERIKLDDSQAETIHDFMYTNGWYPETDGQGWSLTIVDPYGPLTNWGIRDGWRPSEVFQGTPGYVLVPEPAWAIIALWLAACAIWR